MNAAAGVPSPAPAPEPIKEEYSYSRRRKDEGPFVNLHKRMMVHRLNALKEGYKRAQEPLPKEKVRSRYAVAGRVNLDAPAEEDITGEQSELLQDSVKAWMESKGLSYKGTGRRDSVTPG